MRGRGTAYPEAPARGYLALLRDNADFRRLWLGQVVSQLGDWLDYVALFTLLLELTGSGTAAAGMLVARFLPGFFVSPLAGVVVDRFDRKSVMIAADLGRALLVLLLLLVDAPGDVWLVYAVVAAVVVLTSFFEPARGATIPNVTDPADLVAANALSSITWSVSLAVGAAVGGFLTAWAGWRTAIVLDAASFAVSAAFVARVRVPPLPSRAPLPDAPRGVAALLGLADLAEGARYLVARPPLALVALAKGLWSLAGGVVLLHAIFGERVYPIGGSAAAGIGLLATARGLGTALGPVLARRLFGARADAMARAIGGGFFVAGGFYLCFAWVASWPLAALALVGAHMGGSTIWVFSTVLLQRLVPDRLRGAHDPRDDALEPRDRRRPRPGRSFAPCARRRARRLLLPARPRLARRPAVGAARAARAGRRSRRSGAVTVSARLSEMTQRREFEVIVVGTGIAGASLAYFLAEHGVSDVLLLEREPQLAYHSTGRSAATLSTFDGNQTLLRLKVASAPFFRDPKPGFAESPLLKRTGVLGVFPEPAWSAVRAAAPLLRELGLAFELQSTEQVLARVPWLDRNELAGGVLVPDDGRLDVHEILSSYLRRARRAGAEQRLGVEVTGVLVEGGRCRGVETHDGVFRARTVVDAAGAWAGTLARMAGASPIPLVPHRRTIVVFPPPEGVTIGDWPMVASDAHSLYFAPEAGDLMMSPMDEEAMEPCDATPDDTVVAAGLERFARLAPRLAPRTVKRKWSGLRTFSPDRVHVVGEDPRLPGFFWLAGQGGCGIETSPIVGRVAADLIARGRTDAFDAGLLSPARFPVG